MSVITDTHRGGPWWDNERHPRRQGTDRHTPTSSGHRQWWLQVTVKLTSLNIRPG